MEASAFVAGVRGDEKERRMKTSRSQLNRLLDPDNPNVLLETVQKAASAVGKRITIRLEDAR
jgi:antitoxin HicB